MSVSSLWKNGILHITRLLSWYFAYTAPSGVLNCQHVVVKSRQMDHLQFYSGTNMFILVTEGWVLFVPSKRFLRPEGCIRELTKYIHSWSVSNSKSIDKHVRLSNCVIPNINILLSAKMQLSTTNLVEILQILAQR